MTRILKSKYKIDRRLKCNLWGRPKSPFNKRDYPPRLKWSNKKEKTIRLWYPADGKTKT